MRRCWAACSRSPRTSPDREGIADAGYRLVTNVGRWGGQTVDHLHFHLMGGRAVRLAARVRRRRAGRRAASRLARPRGRWPRPASAAARRAAGPVVDASRPARSGRPDRRAPAVAQTRHRARARARRARPRARRHRRSRSGRRRATCLDGAPRAVYQVDPARRPEPRLHRRLRVPRHRRRRPRRPQDQATYLASGPGRVQRRSDRHVMRAGRARPWSSTRGSRTGSSIRRQPGSQTRSRRSASGSIPR